MNKTFKKRKTKKYRAHGFGSLEKRGKMYVARWMVNGQRYTRTTGEHEVAKAREKLEEFTKPYRIGKEIDTLQAHEVKIKCCRDSLQALADKRAALKIDELFEVFRKLPACQEICQHHLERYECVIRRFGIWLKEHRPEITEARKVTRMAAREYADYLTKHRAVATRNVIIRLLRHVWQSIIIKENLENEERALSTMRIWEDKTPRARFEINPWTDIECLSLIGREHARRELTEDELRRICSSITGEMRTLFTIGIYTGMRLADCVLLDWREIDLARRCISVIPRKTRNKSGMMVVIPIHKVLFDRLNQIPIENRQQAVVPNLASKYNKNQQYFAALIKQVFDKCGIKTTYYQEGYERGRCDVGFHSLRYTFVSMAANAGASLELVRKIVGHTSPAMTRHYFHENETALRETVAQIPDVTSGVLGENNQKDPETLDKISLNDNLISAWTTLQRLSAPARREIVLTAIKKMPDEEFKLFQASLEDIVVNRKKHQ